MAKAKQDDRLPVGLRELPPAPASPALAEKPARHRYRVSLEKCRVLVLDPVKEIPVYQDYLDVEAADEWDAIQAFGRYNGIPLKADSLTGKQRLASDFEPRVERLS